ncbi:hypothetical protein JQ596_24525 [Bradyrhizobium manausense]|uniref:hypothetical protein n=1 Tax=Bradyrhizobium TaxID=374 RepID=UPI001BAD746C|nr:MULTISPECIES: hypothetical protein [Bradyrhizobium]MBR0828707.1 hypothetical protein [Bradyrhizobium manausense]UVO32588.1 hypothetical protein KUF59_19140 [Bradyrhizobium arachidis]
MVAKTMVMPIAGTMIQMVSFVMPPDRSHALETETVDVPVSKPQTRFTLAFSKCAIGMNPAQDRK